MKAAAPNTSRKTNRKSARKPCGKGDFRTRRRIARARAAAAKATQKPVSVPVRPALAATSRRRTIRNPARNTVSHECRPCGGAATSGCTRLSAPGTPLWAGVAEGSPGRVDHILIGIHQGGQRDGDCDKDADASGHDPGQVDQPQDDEKPQELPPMFGDGLTA